MEFKDKVIMVTGATGGIGKACVKKYVQEEAKLALFGRSMEKLQELRKEIGYTEENCLLFATDISDEGQIKAAVEKTLLLLDKLMFSSTLPVTVDLLFIRKTTHSRSLKHAMRPMYMEPSLQ